MEETWENPNFEWNMDKPDNLTWKRMTNSNKTYHLPDSNPPIWKAARVLTADVRHTQHCEKLLTGFELVKRFATLGRAVGDPWVAWTLQFLYEKNGQIH